MEFYQLFMFLHIVCVIVWLGCGVSLAIMGNSAIQHQDAGATVRIAGGDFALLGKLFAPAAAGALICGLAMTLLAWDFHELWILIGLGGFAISAAFGATVLGPSRDRVSASVGRHGSRSVEAAREAQRFMILARFDIILLVVMVADMVFKPAPDSYATLAAMGAALIAGGVLIWRQTRAIEIL